MVESLLESFGLFTKRTSCPTVIGIDTCTIDANVVMAKSLSKANQKVKISHWFQINQRQQQHQDQQQQQESLVLGLKEEEEEEEEEEKQVNHHHHSLAPRFKYTNNCASFEIENLRNILKEKRKVLLDKNEPDFNYNDKIVNFHETSFERLMNDDWLVTRFLLRGLKRAVTQERKLDNINININNVDVDVDVMKVNNEEQVDFISNENHNWLINIGLYQNNIKRELNECKQKHEKEIEKKQHKKENENVNVNKQQEQREPFSEPILMAAYRETIQLIEACAEFKSKYNINSNTNLSEFPLDWIEQNGIFNFKPDKSDNSTIYLRVKLHKPKLLTDNEARLKFKRLLLYHLEKCDESLYNCEGKGICCIFDMSNATIENMDIELTSWMIKSLNSFGPKMLAYVMIYNLPWFFNATFKLITNNFLSKSNKQALRFVYGKEILNYIEMNNLPRYLQESLCPQ